MQGKHMLSRTLDSLRKALSPFMPHPIPFSPESHSSHHVRTVRRYVCVHQVVCDEHWQNRRRADLHTDDWALPVLNTFKSLSIHSICFQLRSSGTYHLQMGGSFTSCVSVAVGGLIGASFVGCFYITSPCLLCIHHTSATHQLFIYLEYKYGHTSA